MMQIVLQVGVLLALVLANGLFATAEMAFVAVRKSRLKTLAENNHSRARIALELANSPNRLLSTVQVGITLIGILAGALGGITLAERLEAPLGKIPLIAPYSGPIAVGLVVCALTFLSLVLGELVPKRVALNDPEKLTLLLARPMAALSTLASPIVSILSHATDLGLRLVGMRAQETPAVSEEEIKTLIEQGHHAGLFHKAEITMVSEVMKLDERQVKELMTPRPKIVWLNAADSDEVNWRKIVASNHTYFPLYEGNRDNVLGLISVKALWANYAAGAPAKLKDLTIPPLVVPETMDAIKLLETFRHTRKHTALVTDEFGNLQGLVTLTDILEAIVGQVPEEGPAQNPGFRRREDGSFLVDGMMDIDDLKPLLHLTQFPLEESDEFRTLGGFIMTHLGRIPQEGDAVEAGGYRFEVIDMDRHRVDKVLITGKTSPTSGSKS